MANLDAVATADFIIFALSGNEEVGEWGETCIRSLASFGMGEGSVRGVVSVSAALFSYLILLPD
jgi:pre-rRNA-processing protein TSR1